MNKGGLTEHLAGIENVVWIKCLLEGMHNVQRFGADTVMQEFTLKQTNAMLGRNGAAVFTDQPVDISFDSVVSRRGILS